MSVNPVSSGSELSVEQKKAQYQAQYNEYYNTYTTLINNDDYKSYFAENGELKALKDKLAELLEALNHAFDEIYDEAKIDALMQALGALLSGSDAVMGLEARILAYKELVALKARDSITENDYNGLLAALNSDTPLKKTNFDKVLELAQSRKNTSDFLIASKSQLEEKAAYKTLSEKTNKTITDLLNFDKDALKTYTLDLINLQSDLNQKLTDMMFIANKTIKLSKSASLSMKVIQANNAYRDIEGQLKAEANMDERAQMDENMKRLRDEGIWASTTSKRREEILQEEALQKARAAEQNAERKNI